MSQHRPARDQGTEHVSARAGDADLERAATRRHALSFGAVAAAYERARPAYPGEAMQWLLGDRQLSVVELGAGTGKLTRMLVEAGHDVLAVDPSVEMLDHLHDNAPGARTAVATAESIPAASRSVDAVVCAQSFHWFAHDRALPEMARVLRPGGRAALVWNSPDTSIPWVRKLTRIIGAEPPVDDEVVPFRETPHFGWVEDQQYRFWQNHTLPSLLDLVRSRSSVAVLAEAEREEALDRVRALYDDYGRGPDGMQLPYLTSCFRAAVRHQEPPPAPADAAAPRAEGAPPERPGDAEPTPPPEDPGTTLIDFR